MKKIWNRRQWIETSLFAAASFTTFPNIAIAAQRNIKKTLKLSMIPSKDQKNNPLTYKDRLQMAKKAGFAGVEPDTLFNQQDVQDIKSAADTVGIHLDAIICSKHWSHPLSDPDPNVAEVCMDAMEVSMQNAKDIGADVVLLVPGVVKPNVMYKDAYTRSLSRVKELAPIAEKMGITIALENVWNRFLLSPIEFRDYIDEIDSPRVQAFFDVGNILLYGYPQDWIRTLNQRIVRVDVKDFDLKTKTFVPLLEGSVPWKEVMQALDDIDYSGYFAAEVSGGHLSYLKEKISQPMDKIISM